MADKTAGLLVIKRDDVRSHKLTSIVQTILNNPENNGKTFYVQTFLQQTDIFSKEHLEFLTGVYQIFTEINWTADCRILLPFDDFQLTVQSLVDKYQLTEVWAHSEEEIPQITPNNNIVEKSEIIIEESFEKIQNNEISIITKRLENGVCGGTFDHLHTGHKLLLSVCALVSSKHLTVGVTSEDMLKNKKFKENLQSFEQRVSFLRHFYFSIQPHIREDEYDLNTFPLHDPYGPTLVSTTLQVIIVSQETENWTRANVNPVRESNSLNPLLLISIPLLLSPSHLSSSEKLSSTQLREPKQ